jgi:hypothetical protein
MGCVAATAIGLPTGAGEMPVDPGTEVERRDLQLAADGQVEPQQ